MNDLSQGSEPVKKYVMIRPEIWNKVKSQAKVRRTHLGRALEEIILEWEKSRKGGKKNGK